MFRRSLVSLFLLAALTLLLAGCMKYEDRLLGNLAGGPMRRDWRGLAKAYEKEPNVQVLNLGAAPAQSSHLFVIPSSLASQVSPDHDMTLTILKGKGTAKVKGEEMRVKKGAVIFVPRGDVFEYVNKGKKPTLALGVFSPPREEAGTNQVDQITPPSGLR